MIRIYWSFYIVFTKHLDTTFLDYRAKEYIISGCIWQKTVVSSLFNSCCVQTLVLAVARVDQIIVEAKVVKFGHRIDSNVPIGYLRQHRVPDIVHYEILFGCVSHGGSHGCLFGNARRQLACSYNQIIIFNVGGEIEWVLLFLLAP